MGTCGSRVVKNRQIMLSSLSMSVGMCVGQFSYPVSLSRHSHLWIFMKFWCKEQLKWLGFRRGLYSHFTANMISFIYLHSTHTSVLTRWCHHNAFNGSNSRNRIHKIKFTIMKWLRIKVVETLTKLTSRELSLNLLECIYIQFVGSHLFTVWCDEITASVYTHMQSRW